MWVRTRLTRPNEAIFFYWGAENTPRDIMAYRIIKTPLPQFPRSALRAQAGDDWIPWESVKCSEPVFPDVLVEGQHRNGVRSGQRAASTFWWWHVGDPADIVAYRVVKAAPSADWIPWEGGECPLVPPTPVEVKYRDGNYGKGEARSFNWRHAGGPHDIVAYRSVTPR